MHSLEPKGAAFQVNLLQCICLRRYRNFIVIGLSALGICLWLFSRSDSLGSLGFRPIRPPGPQHGTKDSQKPTTEDQQNGGADTKPSQGVHHLIPHKIWQIQLPKKNQAEDKPTDPEILKDTASWLALNSDYAYTLVGKAGADKFIRDHYSRQTHLVESYNSLANVGMKSDLLRYLILSIEGGVYTDTDTLAIKPIDLWVPKNMRDKVRLIVGIEFDRRDGGGWADIPHWLQFCQWTIAAAPGHPVFGRMVSRALRSIDELASTHNSSIGQLNPSSFEVMNSTGPAAWTDVVFELLQEHDPSLNDTKDLSFMTEPKLYGDILVLTIDGFGMGQSHSHSTHDGSIPDAALMKHLFSGSWRGD